MLKKHSKILLFFSLFFLVGVGILYFSNNCEAEVQIFFKEEGNLIVKKLFTDERLHQKFEETPLSIEKIKPEVKEPKFQGYIIQFEEEPLITEWKKLQERKEKGLLSIASMNSQFEQYRSYLNSKFKFHQSYLRGLIPDFDKRVQREFKDVFNGISLDISAKEVEKIKKLDFVKNVYPNYEVKAVLRDTIPLINADEVWALGYTGSSTVIAIIDTGIDYTHIDLGNCTSTGPHCKVIGGYDFVNNDSDPMDDHGHGTHCAGIAAANGTLKGVAPDANLLAYKVLNSEGEGNTSWVIAGIERAVDPNQDGDYSDHADVISLSLGSWGDPDDALSQTVDNAVDAGAVVTVAAGNEGEGYGTISSPGCAKKVITVGASDKSDNIANFSSRGPVRWDNKVLIKPDLVAPGVSVTSTVPTGVCQLCNPSGYKSFSGTSMATPHVAGAAALIIQAHPDWSPQEIKMVLRNTALDLGEDVLTQGYGRLDVLPAVQTTTTPPIAEFINVQYNVTSTINILGTATSTYFKGYSLYYGPGYNPTSTQWQLICSSTVAVVEGILCSNFDTSLANDGEYLLKLEVRDSFNKVSQDRTLINIDNIRLTHPLNNDIFRAGDTLEIKGTVQGTNFQNYLIEWGLGENPSQWFTTGINLINNGTSQIIDGTLATWVTPTTTNFYSLRLTVNYSGGQASQSEYIKNIYLDSTLKAGWPKRIDWYSFDCPWNGTCYYWGGNLEPVVSDINNDGKKEIIVYTGGKPPKLFVYKQDGSLFWSADIGITEVAGGNLHIPLVGDINNDGFKEIIAYKMNIEGGVADWSGTLYAFNYDGSTLWTSKILTGNDVDFHPTMLMADLDLDGNKEIVVKGNNSAQEKIVIVSNEGSIISQWNLPNSSWGASIVSTPAIGNFDDDSELEIVSVSPTENAGYDREKKEWINEGAIYVYNMDGSVVTGWPVLVPGQPFSSPAVGDINNDGDLEIIVGLLYASDIFPDTRYGGLYAFDKSGNILPGWPFMKGYNFWSSPSLADFDGDGDLEIGASRLGFVTYILHHDGTIASGWPQSTCWNDYYSTIIGDVNSDGSLDILTTAGNGVGGSCYGKGGVYAWNFDGTSISGFPKLTEVDAQAPATIADIDNDGKVELIASSNDDYDYITKAYKHRGTIYVWELNQDYNRDKMKWPMFHHDPQHTGLYNATALTTKVVSVGGDLTLPYYTNTSTPIIVIFGETNMLCRWATSDLFYSQMSTTTPSQCGIEGSTSTCSLTDQGEDGQKTVYISCKDDFGNEQSIYQNLDVTFTLDTKKPEVSSAMAFPDPTKAGPVIITIQFNEEMATDTSPVVEITGLKTLYTVIQSAYDSMTWTGKFELLDNDEERAATISVKGGKDLAGNVMDDNPTAGTFRVDTLAPQKPIVTDPSSPITVNADTYIIKGVAEASALVIIYKEKTSVGNQQLINGAINYSIEVNLAQDQANNFKVTATDAFGNESESTAVPTITEDSTPPTTPTINEVTTPTYSLTQLISGTKEAYTSVWLNQSKIIDLDEKTTWSYEISLSIGENPISITVKDSALNESGVATTSITRIGIGGGGGWVTPVSTIGEGNISESLGGEVRATFKSGQLAKVVFPSHSIKGTVVVKIEPRDKTEVVKTTPLPKNTQIVGELIADFKALSNGKELEKFEGVIPITFTYSDEQVKEAGIDEKTLKIYWWDKSTKTWKPLKSKVNILTNTVTAYTIHFTLFAIMGEIKAKPIEEMTIEELRAKITEILAKIAQLQAQLPQLLKQQITSEIPTSYRFTKPLRLRDKNIEVKYLQLFLKAQGSDIYPEGLVTGYFGYLTLNAVKRFQLKHGIITPKTSPKIAGYVGPQTRAKINEILGR